MKKFIIIAISFLATTSACFFLFSRGEEVRHDQSRRLSVKKVLGGKEVVPVLEAVNARGKRVENLSSGLKAVTQMSGKMAARLNGTLYYSKGKKFRLSLESFLSPELDIGSDGSKFWFWSNRMDEPGLYWSSYDNFYKTRLKTPFNPVWLSRCLGVEGVNVNAKVDEVGGRWRVVEKTRNASGEEITIVTYIDPKKAAITGHGVYDKVGVLEASSEIVEFKEDLPSRISFIWHKENASMVWELTNARANQPIGAENWLMPNVKPIIDMSRE